MCKAEKTFKLEMAVILPILCLALALFATGCGQDRNEERSLWRCEKYLGKHGRNLWKLRRIY